MNLLPYLAAGLGAAVIILGGSLLAIALGATARRRRIEDALLRLQSQFDIGLQQTTQQVDSVRNTFGESLQALTAQLAQALGDTRRTMGDRLDNSTRLMGDMRQRLGQLQEASGRMLELGQDIARLDQILRPPKLRGALGELFLADLLAQVLPAAHYTLQYQFQGGETVDAVIRLQSGMVPIDAKFPLDNFRRLLAAEPEAERRAARRAFVKDIKTHIDAIASKYIRVDEKTFDFALMYIPAENVYYETIIKDDEFGGEMALFSYALKKRVVPVSPNSFYAYLQTIILGLKGMRVEERSREILERLARLGKEFELFGDSLRLIGQHIENASKKYADTQSRFTRIAARVEQIGGLAKSVDEQATAAHPAPAKEEEITGGQIAPD